MMFFPNDAKLCSKTSLKQPNHPSIYKLASSNFKPRSGRKGGEEEEEDEDKKEEEEAKLAALIRSWWR